MIKHFDDSVDRVLFSQDKEENTVLHLAAKFGHLGFVQSVLERFKECRWSGMLKHLVLIKNSDEETLLHLACLSQVEDEISREFIEYVLGQFDSRLLLKVS